MENALIEILLIEDALAEAGLIREMLAEPGKQEFSVEHVRYLAEGLGQLASRNFDVILVDLGLPDSRGLETALAVRNQAKRTPIVVMTVHDGEEEALKALQLDIQDYLIKGEITGNVLKRSIHYAIQRKHDIEALRQCEQRFACIMHNLPVAAWIKDERGRYVHTNAEHARTLFMSFSEYLGKTDEEFLPMETARRLRENDAQVLTTGENLQTFESLRLDDGTDHHFIVRKFPVPGPDGRATYVGGIAMDITERVRAEEALLKSERKFARIFHSVPALVVISTLKEGMFVDVNDTTLQLLGYRRDEMIGRTALELNLWADLSDRDAILQTLEKEGAAKNIEVRLRGKSGQTLVGLYSAEYIEFNGDRFMLSVVRDITDRKQAEEALRFSEARFRALHDDNPAMILTIDAKGNIISTNPACTGHLGYTADELEGQPVLKLFHEDDRPVVTEQLQMCRQNPDQVYRWQSRKIRKDGGLLWVEELARAVCDLNGALNVLIVCQDITERKHAEEALQKSERKFAKVFHAVPALIAISTLKEGRYVDVNETLLRTLGYRRDEIIGRTALELNVWEDMSERARMMQALEEKGSVENIEVRIRGKNGQPLVGLLSAEFIDFNGDRYVINLMKDITLKRQAQEQVERLNTQLAARADDLEEVNRVLADDLEAMKMLQKLGMLFLHEENLEQILSQVLDAAIAISGADFGNIQIMDPKTCCLRIAVQHGFPQWWLDFWNSVVEGHGVCGTALRRSERVIVEDVEQSSIFVGTEALEIQLKAGVRAVQSTPLVSRSGSTLGMFSTHYKAPHRPTDHELRLLDLLARHAADFIEHVQLREMLAARALELESANRELEAFNYTVAHDLRKPLTVVNGYCQAVREMCGNELDEQCSGYLREAYDGTLRMNQLIDTLLDFSRLAHVELHRESFDISAMVHGIAAELQLAEPARRVSFRIAEGIPVNGDVGLIRVVMENILGNAWKYTGAREESVIEFGMAEFDGEPAYFVRDNGPGFVMADAEKLFIPFQRLPGSGEFMGHGIGLATVERIIRRHGGRIWAEGEPEKGATFYFTVGGL